MSAATARLLAALRERGIKPHRSGSGWSARCPAHDDKNPSLSIGTGEDQRCLVSCHAGCDTKAIVAAVGLQVKDLMPEREKPVRQSETKSAALATKPKAGHFATSDEAVTALERKLGPCARRWVYTDASGAPMGEVVRWDPPGERKQIRPLTRRGDRWMIEAMPEPRPLLHLPELSLPDGAWVYICEGEKAVDAARAIGVVATTSAGGSKAAAKTDWSVLKNKIVVIMPDHDSAGEQYAAAVARLCLEAGAEVVRVLRLAEHWPSLKEGGDIVDVLALECGDAKSVHDRLDAIALTARPCAGDDHEVDAAPNNRPIFCPDRLFPSGIGHIREFFSDLSRSTQTPPEMAALLGLAIASACVSNVACVRGHGDHIEPAPLWALVLSDPGTRKSAVLAELLFPILRWESEQAREIRPIIAAAIERHRIVEKRIQRIEDRASKELDRVSRADMEAEAIQLAQQLAADPIPTLPALLASEPTPEALVRQMKDNHGRALLASAEGDAIDIVQGRYSGVRNYGAMLKGHAGDPIRAQRVGRLSDVIDRPALAVALCVQRAAVEELWLDPQAQGRGFLARFAVVAPPDLVGARDVRPAPIRASARDAWQSAIDSLLAQRPGDPSGAGPTVLSLSPEADAIYHAFQIRTEAALGLGDLADRRAWGGKLCGLALRIALTLHALATWGRNRMPADPSPINAEMMAAAVAWAEYLAVYERHARLTIIDPAEERVVCRQVEQICRLGGSVSVRDWQRLRSHPTAMTAVTELDELVAAGVGRWENPAPGPRGGRPSRLFVLASKPRPSDTTPLTAEPGGPVGQRAEVSSVLSVSEAGNGRHFANGYACDLNSPKTVG